MAAPHAALQERLRALAPEVLGILCRRTKDFAAAEDAVQEALVAAAQHWAADGLPEQPRAWLVQVASRRLTDEVRMAIARRAREQTVVSLVPAEDQLALGADDDAAVDDDSLALLFMCCHPSLSPTSAIALTLRAVGGLTTVEIARAFLVPEATMAQRISRAKQSIRESGVPFERPDPQAFADRLGAVLHVLYLMFSEGYAASSGDAVVRTDLSGEAVRVTRLLHRLVPDEPEVAGLLALLLLTDARRAARTGPAGELVPLDQQDRARWDRQAIREGVALLDGALPKGRPGPYQLQAAVAALHDEAPSAAQTDWPQIVALYEVLRAQSDNPMVDLNHAIATAMVQGPAAGLALLDHLASDARLAGTHRLDAVRAHLLERAGDLPGAVALYRRAAGRTASTVERDYLLAMAARLNAPSAPGT